VKTPAHWYRRAGALAWLLSPVGAVYQLATAIRLAQGKGTGVPGITAICVGNVTAGGAGKTPIAIALAKCALQHGLKAAVVTKGHRGRLTGPVPVDLDAHSLEEVGDEALVIAEDVPCILAKDRAAGLAYAAQHGFTVAIFDDGLQDPAVAYDHALLVVDHGAGLGNGLGVPAGPLRERAAAAARRVEAVLRVQSGPVEDPPALPPLLTALPMALCPITLNAEDLAALTGRRLVAFCGLGLPEKVFDSWRSAGLHLVEAVAFPDHHAYTPADLAWLAEVAEGHGADLVTTAKDHVRLPPALRDRIAVQRAGVEPDRLSRVIDALSLFSSSV